MIHRKLVNYFAVIWQDLKKLKKLKLLDRHLRKQK